MKHKLSSNIKPPRPLSESTTYQSLIKNGQMAEVRQWSPLKRIELGIKISLERKKSRAVVALAERMYELRDLVLTIAVESKKSRKKCILGEQMYEESDYYRIYGYLLRAKILLGPYERIGVDASSIYETSIKKNRFDKALDSAIVLGDSDLEKLTAVKSYQHKMLKCNFYDASQIAYKYELGQEMVTSALQKCNDFLEYIIIIYELEPESLESYIMVECMLYKLEEDFCYFDEISVRESLDKWIERIEGASSKYVAAKEDFLDPNPLNILEYCLSWTPEYAYDIINRFSISKQKVEEVAIQVIKSKLVQTHDSFQHIPKSVLAEVNNIIKILKLRKEIIEEIIANVGKQD